MARSNYRVLEVKENFATVTDNSRFEFTIGLTGIEGARPNDTISADTQVSDPTVLINGFLERGGAAVRPATFVPEVVKPFNPNEGASAYQPGDGAFPLSPSDVDTMLRNLMARVRKLEAFAPKHCSVCSAHIAAKGAFDK
jgi:hypothetical protein